MEFSISTVAAIIALLVSVSATYNAYMLRGGNLAWSQVLTALGTVSLMFSLTLPQSVIFEQFTSKIDIFSANLSDLLYILGFLLLFLGSLKLRSSLQ